MASIDTIYRVPTITNYTLCNATLPPHPNQPKERIKHELENHIQRTPNDRR